MWETVDEEDWAASLKGTLSFFKARDRLRRIWGSGSKEKNRVTLGFVRWEGACEYRDW